VVRSTMRNDASESTSGSETSCTHTSKGGVQGLRFPYALHIYENRITKSKKQNNEKETTHGHCGCEAEFATALLRSHW
jgi:hypothetical protein